MSSKIQGITVEIGGDTTKLGNALKSVNSKAKDLQSELKGVNTLLKMDPKNVTLLKQKQDLLNESITNCKEKLEKLKSTQAQVQKQFEKGEITNEQFRDFQREIISTENKLKSLEKESKSFGNVSSQQIALVGSKMKNLGGNIENVGKKMLGATAVIGATGAAAITFGSNFDDAMKQVAATMGITVDEINNGNESYKILEDVAKKCGETTKFSATESAEALNYLALAGYDAQKSAETLPKVLNLAAAGGLNLATASDMVTDAMAALGMETSELDKYIDEMAKTSQKSNTSVAQLGEATLTCAGTVKMSGMSLETMNTELGILANNGIKGAEGGTHLRNIILSLTSPTDTATKALKNLGISVLDSKGNIRDLNDIMIDFNSKLDGLSDGKKTEIISTIFNKTDISAVNALLKGSGEEFSNLKSEISNCNNAASNMADTMNSSLGGQVTLLKSQLEGIAIQVSEILMPVLKSIIEKVSNLLNWISQLNPKTKEILVVIAGVVASIGPLLIIIGKLMSSIGSILIYAPKIVSLLGIIKTAASGLFTVLAANPIVLIIGAIVALIAIFVTLWNKCEWFRNFWIGLWENIKSVFNSVIGFIVSLVKKEINRLMTIANFINTYVIQPIWNIIQSLCQFLESCVTWINTYIIQPIWNKIQESLLMLKVITEWINTNVIQPILRVVIPIVQKIQEISSKIWEIITTLFGVLCQWIYDNVIYPTVISIHKFVQDVTQFFQNIWNKIVEIFSVVGNWFADRFREAKESIILVFSVIGEWFSNKFTEVKESIIKSFIPIIQWFAERWNEIQIIFSTVSSFFSDIFQRAWDGIKNAFSNVSTFFQNIWNTIKNMFTNIGTTIGNSIGNAFKTVVNSIINFAENTINKFIRAINSAIGLINNIPGVNIGKLKELSIPKLKVGMANVPYDDYLALLHKGERVLTAKENQNYSSQSIEDGNYIMGGFSHLNDLLGEYLPGILDATRKQKDVYLDTGTWVGATIDQYDEALGNNFHKKVRGN